MTKNKVVNVGIGFATGRKNFQKVLRTNIHNWKESGLVESIRISLNLFVAYDLDYRKTKRQDYTATQPELVKQVDQRVFLGTAELAEERARLVKGGILTEKEAGLLFYNGYAGKRNAVLYSALRHHMDYLIFMDDDEYPMAVTNTRDTAVWSGQFVLATHLKYIGDADVTHGYHCGYISPIPCLEFKNGLTEEIFKCFIQSISNDIINWDSILKLSKNGGITYADPAVLTSDQAVEVTEVNHAKFISGANLCLNLMRPERLFPFYNPPGARGEDAFLGTLLHERKVLKVPCYTFHDGFMTYNNLLEGLLPIHLKAIRGDMKQVVGRFYRACVGWVRYRPLLLQLTRPQEIETLMDEMRTLLSGSASVLSQYFGRPEFNSLIGELEQYYKAIPEHQEQFFRTQEAWKKLMLTL